MMLNSVVVLVLACSWYVVDDVAAHGRLMDPPARNSMWRLGFNNPVNYNDNELFCGGRMVQWLRNNGKCGVCGDPYHGNQPHEAGGKYANGIVTRSYHEGDEIRVTVHLTANHLGWFEFRLCPVNDPKKKATQKCLDQHLLTRPDGKGEKYFVPKGKYNAFFNYTLQLPEGLSCKQCVMQWKYRTGNTWDKDTESGLFCLGCGPQEEFYNCADVEILPKGKNSKWTKEEQKKEATTKKPIGPKHKPESSKSKFKPFTSKPKVTIKEKITPAPVLKFMKTPPPKSSNDLSVREKARNVMKKTEQPVSSRNEKIWVFDDNDNAINLKRELKHPQDSKYNWRASSDRFTWPAEALKENQKISETLTFNPIQSTNSPIKRRKPWVVQTSKLRSVKRHRNPFYKYRKGARTLRIRVQNDEKKPAKTPTETIDPENCITVDPKPKHTTLSKRPSVTQIAKLSRSPFRMRGKARYLGYRNQMSRRQNDVSVSRNTPVVHRIITQPQQRVQQMLHQPHQLQLMRQPQHVQQQQQMLQQPQLLQQQQQQMMPHPQGTRSYAGQPQRLWYQYQPFGYFWGRSVRPVLKCRAIITLGGGMDEWCTANCNANFCPGAMCVCKQEVPIYPSYSIYPQTVPWSKTYSQPLINYNSNTNQRYSVPAVQPVVVQSPIMQPQSVRTQKEVQQPRVIQTEVVQPQVIQTQSEMRLTEPKVEQNQVVVTQSEVQKTEPEVEQNQVVGQTEVRKTKPKVEQTQVKEAQSNVSRKQSDQSEQKDRESRVMTAERDVTKPHVVQSHVHSTPAMQTPRTQTSRTQTSRTQTSRTQTSRTQTPRTQTPRTQTSRTQTSPTQTSRTQTSPTQTSRAQTSRTQTSRAQTSRAQTSRTQTSRAQTTQSLRVQDDHPNLENRIRRIQKQAKRIQQKAPKRSSSPYASRYNQKDVAGSVNHKTVKTASRYNQKDVAGSVNHKTVKTARLANQKHIVSVKGRYICKATGRYRDLPQFDDWCHENCMEIICPLLICECRSQ